MALEVHKSPGRKERRKSSSNWVARVKSDRDERVYKYMCLHFSIQAHGIYKDKAIQRINTYEQVWRGILWERFTCCNF